MKISIDKKIKGFTLLETVIAIALFTTITLSILGIFSKIIQIQYEIYDMQAMQNNARYFMEVLSKEARMARIDESGSCSEIAGRVFYVSPAGAPILKFLNYKGECVAYKFDSDEKKIYKSINEGSQISMISGDIDVESAGFIRFDDLTLGIQPIVSFRAIISSPNYADESKKIKIQTTISARVYP